MAKHPKPKRTTHFIKEWREFRGLTQDQLAERIERSRGLIAQYETYRSSPSIESLRDLANALQCEPNDLLQVNPTKEGQVIDMTRLLREATPEQRAQVEEYARFVIRRQ